MVRADQDRPRTAPDPTTQPIDIGAGAHHAEGGRMRVRSGRCFSGSEALLSGHSRGVDVGIAEAKQGQMLWVSVSIPMGNWLAAMSVVSGRVKVLLTAAVNELQQWSGFGRRASDASVVFVPTRRSRQDQLAPRPDHPHGKRVPRRSG